MKRLTLLIVLLILFVITFPLGDVFAFGGGLTGNEACDVCLEEALRAKKECEGRWDYGEGDPECIELYNGMAINCQTSACIY